MDARTRIPEQSSGKVEVEMLGDLWTERRNPASARIDQAPVEELLRIMNEEDARVAGAVAVEIPQIARAVEAITGRLRAGGRLFYIGAGTSGRLGVLDASECPPTFNVPPEMVQGIIAGGEAALSRATEASEDDPEAGAADLKARGFESRDTLVGIAASGRTPYVLGAVRAARQMGALTIGISCTPGSQLAAAVDIPITPLPGPEVIAGSTRLKCGTATKLILNMLTTATMIRLGYVYQNLMVNVQPRNEKLRDRVRRILQEIAGLDSVSAVRLLEESGGDLRTAIVMALKAVSREEARRRLEAAGGVVAAALQD